MLTAKVWNNIIPYKINHHFFYHYKISSTTCLVLPKNLVIYIILYVREDFFTLHKKKSFFVCRNNINPYLCCTKDSEKHCFF